MDPGIFLGAQQVADPCEGVAKRKQPGKKELTHEGLN
jgi:hypothetical protein